MTASYYKRYLTFRKHDYTKKQPWEENMNKSYVNNWAMNKLLGKSNNKLTDRKKLVIL